MRILISMAILLCLVGLSCDDDDNESVEIVIKTGSECGWCGGRDSLTITKLSSSYAFRSPCPEIEDKNRNAHTNPAEWNELLATLNWDDFNKVQVNTCAMCADGCDTWISVEKNQKTHRIRFTESSEEIEPIRPFVDKLDSLIEEFRQN
jgi:hypothetical protein